MRRFLLALLIAPALASAQGNAVLETLGIEDPAFATRNFGAQFEDLVPVGPVDLVFAVDAADDGADGDGTMFDGCSSFNNPDEIAGNFALISRGACPFVTKAENAANAGAIAYVVYNDERVPQTDTTLVHMDGTCDSSVCSVPGIFISRETFKLNVNQKFGQQYTITVSFSGSPTAAEEETAAGTYRLAPVYPNPIATTAQVGFTLPAAENARVEVFDLIGRRVATLTDGLRAAGEHTVTLDASALPGGVYVVRLATPSTTLAERVTVVR
ncbi:MAG: PA domain-containing protein [Bacteroidota bacterium]